MWTLPARIAAVARNTRREFHDYFVTHLPSSSLHPDSRTSTGPHHKLPRDKSVPHTPSGPGRSPAAPLPGVGLSRETTVVRIPIKSAKHHFGVSVSRGTRPYNEDTFQVGTIDVPAFAKRRPISISKRGRGGADGEGTSADGASGDPQVFYFAVFDGHGGVECSEFLSERLHNYIEDGGRLFELQSTLKERQERQRERETGVPATENNSDLETAGKESLRAVKIQRPEENKSASASKSHTYEEGSAAASETIADDEQSLNKSEPKQKVQDLEVSLVAAWRNTVGGYFRRFKPEFFSLSAGGAGRKLDGDSARDKQQTPSGASIESMLTYAFLRADLDFVTAQASKPNDEDPVLSDRPLNDDDNISDSKPASQNFKQERSPSQTRIGGPKRFKGGSTASIILVSTPTPTPFWHPASPSSLISAHVGDTRTLLCATATGLAVPLTTDHHPSSPVEAGRLRRYAATFVTDSFGEERMGTLANTRAFGDVGSKRVGVSAEPEIRRVELSPAEYAFIVLMSDGISGTLSDQEVVDIVKEARTPEQAARDVVAFATDVSEQGDNATCLVVRLGGWERRQEGGLGSFGTKDAREWRRNAAMDPRSKIR